MFKLADFNYNSIKVRQNKLRNNNTV